MNVPVTVPVPMRCLLALLLLTFNQCEAQLRNPQVRITGADTVGHTFLQEGPNVIENREHLDHFFEKLYYQRVAGGRRISIVHIGDSHILGNFLTREVRARLQNAFGDAGRGLIFPYRLAGTHGPKDYLVETNVRWQGSNCNANLDDVTPYGVSGFALETYNQTGELSVRMRDTATSETRMLTKITIFSRQPESEVVFTVTDPISNQTATQLLAGDNFRSYYFDRPVTQFVLQYKRTASSKSKKLVIDGISVENEMAGVVYHSIGVNGSRYSDFARAKHFAKEVGDLMPDLIILSFGTNEGQMPIAPNSFYKQIQTLVDQLLETCPGTAILITTPADSYLRGKGFNPHLPDVTATLRRFANNRKLAIWDLYGIGGGEQSAQTWKEKGLMASDSVHFSKVGYTAQGKLLYQAIVKGYQEYIRPVVPAETKK